MKKNKLKNLMIYLIFYSFIGFLIETCFGFFTKGIIESRKSFIYGPFCAIYGIGAVLMILILKKEKKLWKIFIGGAIIGAIVEYGMSLFCEKIFGVKWWDYSNLFLNINGRTCLMYAAMWGVLAIVLMKFVNPFLDKILRKFYKKPIILNIFSTCLTNFFIFDAILTSYALKTFYFRIATEQNLEIENKTYIQEKYQQTSEEMNFFNNMYFGNSKMLETYPNLMICGKNNKVYYIDKLVDKNA